MIYKIGHYPVESLEAESLKVERLEALENL
jgi:hypothetical protein